MRTHVTIEIRLSNPGSTSTGANQTFDLRCKLADDQLSPRANKALRAAAASLGVKLPKPPKTY